MPVGPILLEKYRDSIQFDRGDYMDFEDGLGLPHYIVKQKLLAGVFLFPSFEYEVLSYDCDELETGYVLFIGDKRTLRFVFTSLVPKHSEHFEAHLLAHRDSLLNTLEDYEPEIGLGETKRSLPLSYSYRREVIDLMDE